MLKGKYFNAVDYTKINYRIILNEILLILVTVAFLMFLQLHWQSTGTMVNTHILFIYGKMKVMTSND